MKMRRIISKGLVLSGMPAAQLRMLEQVALHADPSGSPAASERLYQSPVKQPQNVTDEELVTMNTERESLPRRLVYTRVVSPYNMLL